MKQEMFLELFLNATQKFTDREENTGELKITYLDLTNQTISGTFFFDIIVQNGKLREIREGRFDMQFTQKLKYLKK
jgi:flagellar basal body rod protein FlgG